MNLNELLRELSKIGVKLSSEGDQLKIQAAKGVLTPEYRDLLIQHKNEILALLQQNSHQTSLPPIIPDPEHRYEPFPLTDMQHAFWVGRMGVLELGHVANHGYYEIEGQDLNLDRLNWALNQLIDRHDMLRGVMLPDGQQQVLKEVPPYEIKALDLREKAEAIVNFQIEAIRQEMSHQVLPWDQWPLFEFRATLLNQGKIRLHISYDLQIFDAWSLFRLFEEWFQLCQDPQTVLPPLNFTFRDYVFADKALQETPLFDQSRDYWLKRIDSLPPSPDLPLAKNPSTLQKHHCQRFSGELDRDTWQQLKKRATAAGMTASGVLLAAFAEVLTRWSKSPRFTLNLALFNRLPFHPQIHDILGDFTSVTLLAVDNTTPDTFKQRALRLQQQLWQDLDHRYFSGVRVMRELNRLHKDVPSAMPIVFTSTLGFEALGQETSAFDRLGKMVYGVSQASQVWLDHQVSEYHGALRFTWDAVEELFPPGMIEDMFKAYGALIEGLATSEALWQETSLPLLPSWQIDLRKAINATEMPLPDVTLWDLFTKQVSVHGDNPAVISSKGTLTYNQLYQQSCQLGQHLRELGVNSNELVAILMDKGWEQIVAVMGILAAGAAYLPIDPNLPPERIAYQLENSQTKIILTQSWLAEGNTEWAIVNEQQRTILSLNTFPPSPPHPLTTSPSPSTSPDDLAYVIYTSGTTGLPKGVMISHRNVVNVVTYTNQRFGVTERDRLLGLTSLNHDLSVYDIFGALSTGASIVLPDGDRAKDPHHWTELMLQEGVTLWNSVPAMMEMLLDYLENSAVLAPKQLRLAILGGDWLPLTLPNRLRSLIPEVQMLSIGGPTETTIWNIGYEIDTVDPTWKSIPYGRPMGNSQYYILSETLEDCPVWVPGQMYCGGVQVAKGYWQDEEKTRDRFIRHPRTGERIYATGDLGCYLPDRNIQILGRVDFQVKIRGHRIEIGEIEAILRQHPGINAALVQADHNKLFAYLIANPNASPTIAELKAFLKNKLPDYMIPSGFIFLEEFPLSANGKVDRLSLPNPRNFREQEELAYLAPQTELETLISQAWKEVLKIEKISVSSNFFDLGGNSLLITKVYGKLKQQLPQTINPFSVVDLFKYPTIESFSAYLSETENLTLLSDMNKQREEALKQGKNRLQQKFKRSRQLKL
ncbi:amino acid adenylation domain protein [Rippkaea orientalis PCC 8801]|uniref:Amino acid adenylation domain protein n=1 Tax=Rippkaea orientalis (strain PCC 8801 / RF-1) TaxID=41431 RepID=B7JWG3_RIPO1|nr:non-ribosomal peptide synthetase [Rippkaea orientalis]ACK67008.1 amino acid adenylation domain protein [Rippkaea orientalis PCC 8801]